mmetsp:Transcript_59230/g.176025  ORF Transcript_59230/g.176025 Transcript_59230/m.176025 type:complete len:119 (-) Transcript_59230:872-1228(-)
MAERSRFRGWRIVPFCMLARPFVNPYYHNVASDSEPAPIVTFLQCRNLRFLLFLMHVAVLHPLALWQHLPQMRADPRKRYIYLCHGSDEKKSKTVDAGQAGWRKEMEHQQDSLYRMNI